MVSTSMGFSGLQMVSCTCGLPEEVQTNRPTQESWINLYVMSLHHLNVFIHSDGKIPDGFDSHPFILPQWLICQTKAIFLSEHPMVADCLFSSGTI